MGEEGEMTLHYSSVPTSGQLANFYCIIPALLSFSALYSKPNLNLEPSKNLKPGDLVTVTCHAFRGYPAATVLWQDGQGNNITENVTTSQVANEEGLFDVQSVLQVVLEPNSTYSCLVQNPVLQQETHASVTITGEPGRVLWRGWAYCPTALGIQNSDPQAGALASQIKPREG